MIDCLMREKWKDADQRKRWRQRTKCHKHRVESDRERTLFHQLALGWRWWSAWQNEKYFFFLGNEVHYGRSAGTLLRDFFCRHPMNHSNKIRESPISFVCDTVITLSKSSLHVIFVKKNTYTMCFGVHAKTMIVLRRLHVVGVSTRVQQCAQIFWRTHIHIHFNSSDNVPLSPHHYKMRFNFQYELRIRIC